MYVASQQASVKPAKQLVHAQPSANGQGFMLPFHVTLKIRAFSTIYNSVIIYSIWVWMSLMQGFLAELMMLSYILRCRCN